MLEPEFLSVKIKEIMSHFADAADVERKPDFNQDFVNFFLN